jgi:hypothetical protein
MLIMKDFLKFLGLDRSNKFDLLRPNGQKFTIAWAETCSWPSVYGQPSPLFAYPFPGSPSSLSKNGRRSTVSRNCVLGSCLFERLLHPETNTLRTETTYVSLSSTHRSHRGCASFCSHNLIYLLTRKVNKNLIKNF